MLNKFGIIGKMERTADNGKTWVFTLRDDVKFHDGTPMAAKEVVNSLTLALNKPTALGHHQHEFVSSEHRKQELTRFLNFYNTVRPHSSLTKKDEITGKTLTFTPYEWLEFYFKQSVNNG
ncbi:ABC transporter substrate-binding protein [Moraxella bovis]|uniref:ABC-type oligopeptide transport system, periplasmic component n=1 Tax=Moraxella bovis TaxID=476 RepID=A0A378Q0G0_MORBO|nr:ABC transporter substrate-binding protein [Moraxella bovis]STY93678.1 ABC-type oligopeptide transport system, periplasmic component [Moraxella bovis]